MDDLSSLPSGLKPGLKIGIDATNLRLGGGITHLYELLNAFCIPDHGINEIVVWGSEATLSRLPSRRGIKKISPQQLNGPLHSRILWQLFSLDGEVQKEECDLLFVPGGSYLGSFHPTVVMSQNLLPFEWGELKRSGLSVFTLKMCILRLIQSLTFRRVDGVIFLTEYAKDIVLRVTGSLRGKIKVIAHGFSHQFTQPTRVSRSVDKYSNAEPFKLLYVSNIDAYKHQIPVLRAVESLRQMGYPLKLQFIGPGIPKYIDRLNQSIMTSDPSGTWVSYDGHMPYEMLAKFYTQSDVGIFASSCETFGITLLEKMASGLAIACSDRSCMREILGEGGVYFNPENDLDIARAIETYLLSPHLQSEKRALSYQLAQNYSWEKCAEQTFQFLQDTARSNKATK